MRILAHFTIKCNILSLSLSIHLCTYYMRTFSIGLLKCEFNAKSNTHKKTDRERERGERSVGQDARQK